MGGLFGGGGGGTAPVLDKSAFDLSGAAKKYGGFSDTQLIKAKQRQDFTNAANQQLIQQLQNQAGGQAPSLAQAQLKAMQDRGLAQTMAAAASQRGGNPALAQRQLMMQQAAAGRANAQQGAILGLQERQGAQGLLAGQLTAGQGMADQLATGSINQGFGQQQQAKNLMSQYESQRFGADVSRQNAIHGQQGALLGNIIGAAGTVAGGIFGGPIGAGLGGMAGKAVGGMLSGGGGSASDQTMGSSFEQRKDPAGGGYHLSDGGMVPGKEKVAGDSLKNDVVSAKLSPGEVVVPKSVVQAGPDAAKAFIEAIMKTHVPSKSVGFASVVSAKPKKMSDGGRVPMPAEKAPPKGPVVEKPVQNEWKGADVAYDNLKRALMNPWKDK